MRAGEPLSRVVNDPGDNGHDMPELPAEAASAPVYPVTLPNGVVVPVSVRDIRSAVGPDHFDRAVTAVVQTVLAGALSGLNGDR